MLYSVGICDVDDDEKEDVVAWRAGKHAIWTESSESSRGCCGNGGGASAGAHHDASPGARA